MADQGNARKHRRPGLSSLLAIAMVLAAGGLTWYGLRPPAAAGYPTDEPAATIPTEAPRAAVRGPESGLPTRVVVPAAGIDTAIDEVGVVQEEGTSFWQTAWRAAGHHIDSALPGNPGNVVLTGHVSVASSQDVAVFSSLDQVAVGDVVEVYSGDQLYQYRVDTVLRVPPDAVDVLRSDHIARVTLITCTPDLQDRLVVVGTLVS